jgi:O-antigen ligase
MQVRQGILYIYYILLCLLAFSISLPFIYSTVCIVLVSIAWVLQFNGRIILQRLKQRKIVWLWVLLFLQLSLSYFYSTDKAASAADLQRKLSLLALPIIIGLGPALKNQWMGHIFTSFISGIVLIACFCLGRGLIHYISTGQTDLLFYHSLVTGLTANAVYYAWYTIFALGILLLYNFTTGFMLIKWVRYTLLLITFLFFVLLSSKTLLVLLVVFVLPLYFFNSKTKKFSKTQVTSMVILTLLSLSTIVFTNNPIKTRYKEMLTGSGNSIIVGQTPKPGEELVFNNFSLRVFLWKMSWKNINEHNLWFRGCGNGDVALLQKQQIERYSEQTHSLVNQPDLSHFNLHNMYLQILMTLGLPGLIVFLLMTLLPFALVRNIKSGGAFLVFLVASLLFMQQESVLQTQAGVVYFIFFSQVLLLFYYTRKERYLPAD